MVKSLTAIGIAIALLLGLAIFEWYFLDGEFSAFGAEVQILYDKAEQGTANEEDAKIVQARWEKRRDRLHVWIPHNDIARMDEVLAEAVELIAERAYTLALPKLEVLIHMSECLPGTYRPNASNIF